MAVYANMERFFPLCNHKPKRKRNLSTEPASAQSWCAI